MKKTFLLILLVTLRITLFSQASKIYHAVFTDSLLFKEIARFLGVPNPKKILVEDSTATWRPNFFWIGGLSGKSWHSLLDTIPKLDEYHVYRKGYFFSDSLLSSQIPDAEKKVLESTALKLPKRKIDLNHPNYQTVKHTTDYTGFRFSVAEPILSTDGQYAFTHFYIKYLPEMDTYVGHETIGKVTTVLKKTDAGKWMIIKQSKYYY